MTPRGRLNGVIGALESGQPAFVTFAAPSRDEAVALAASPYDGVIVETEHTGFDLQRVQDFLQYLLDRRLLVAQASLAPAVTPLVRIPANGAEHNQWFAKQVLDVGAYGVVWPHIDTVEQARAAVLACRYPTGDAPGWRGWGAGAAARYFGLSSSEYYERAEVWPLDPDDGEILVVIMVESGSAVGQVARILTEVPGVGVVFIGHGDLSRSLGRPGDYDHADVRAAETTVLESCASAGVACGLVTNATDVERRLDEGYRFIVVQPERTFHGLDRGRRYTGR
jgi:4-hydroxy-2-oxoheptanedioate aldolase